MTPQQQAEVWQAIQAGAKSVEDFELPLVMEQFQSGLMELGYSGVRCFCPNNTYWCVRDGDRILVIVVNRETTKYSSEDSSSDCPICGKDCPF